MTSRITSPPRRTRRKAALALAGAASALLALAGSAGAATFTPADTAALTAAIATANSTPAADTIVLAETFYVPDAPYTLTGDLTITGLHNVQAFGAGPQIDGASIVPNDADAITIAAGANVKFQGIALSTLSNAPFASVQVRGALTMDGVSVQGTIGGIQVASTGSLTATNTQFIQQSATTPAINSLGPVVLNNSSVLDNQGGGIFVAGAGTIRLNNSVLFNNQGSPPNPNAKDCFTPAIAPVASRDGDSSCGVTSHGDPLVAPQDLNGGPTLSQAPLAGSPLINAGNAAACPAVDIRYFVRPVGACDIGPFEVGATRDLTPPACVVTALRAGPPKQQDVTLTDGGSGIGPDGVRPDDITIANGTVGFTPFLTAFRSPASAPAPSNPGLVLTATKSNAALVTQWSFIARDWAGNTKLCQ